MGSITYSVTPKGLIKPTEVERSVTNNRRIHDRSGKTVSKAQV